MHNIFVLQQVYYIPLHVSSTVVLIIRRSKLHYTASGIITRLLFSFIGCTKIECPLCLTSKTRSKTQESLCHSFTNVRLPLTLVAVLRQKNKVQS